MGAVEKEVVGVKKVGFFRESYAPRLNRTRLASSGLSIRTRALELQPDGDGMVKSFVFERNK